MEETNFKIAQGIMLDLANYRDDLSRVENDLVLSVQVGMVKLRDVQIVEVVKADVIDFLKARIKTLENQLKNL